ncbi:uncharacterized protein LOC132029175 isoform X2 [Mustela nigripes]|uniref:uncharacterized protein LOC132029175 isoform X2 n=2 Tax=Mustela nigripes TaxID=77151 RepID=UPI00281641F9|nr:uncharacterized protein LOC132029175 isoform X2 [Mustela nigripes]
MIWVWMGRVACGLTRNVRGPSPKGFLSAVQLRTQNDPVAFRLDVRQGLEAAALTSLQYILSLAMSSELCPCRVRRDSAVRASAEEWQRGQSSPLSDHTPVLTFPTSLSSYLPDLQKTCHPAMPGSLSTLSMRASRTEASPNRDRSAYSPSRCGPAGTQDKTQVQSAKILHCLIRSRFILLSLG